MAPRIFLKPGDILLYGPKGIFGRIIATKTWHRVAHVEVYDGQLKSWASRDGQGVNLYDFRLADLAYVLRPTMPLNLDAARGYGRSMIGTPYGWLDLFQFVGLNIGGPGIVCSPFAAAWLRAAGWDVFPADPVERVAPFQFLDLVGPGVCAMVYTPEMLRESLS